MVVRSAYNLAWFQDEGMQNKARNVMCVQVFVCQVKRASECNLFCSMFMPMHSRKFLVSYIHTYIYISYIYILYIFIFMIFSGRSSRYELAYCLVCIVLLILSFICQKQWVTLNV